MNTGEPPKWDEEWKQSTGNNSYLPVFVHFSALRLLLHCPSVQTHNAQKNWSMNNFVLLTYSKEPLVYVNCAISRFNL